MEFKTREPSSGLRRRKTQNDDVFLQKRVESILTENSYTSIQFINLDKLISFKNQRRCYFDNEKINILAETIREHGIRQPLTVIQSEEDSNLFEIVSGERRYLAAKVVGLDKVPCIIIHSRNAAEEIAVIENVQRVDLHPIELGRAYLGLLHKGIVSSNSDLSAKIGVPRTQVSEYISFAKIPESIAAELISNNISSRRILRKISKAVELADMEEILLSALGVKSNIKRKTILKFFLSGSDVEMVFTEKLNLSKAELELLSGELENTLKMVKHKIEESC